MDTVVFCARRSHSLMLRSAETVATRWLWGSNRHRVMQERWRSDQSKHTLTDAHRSIIADRATCDLSYRWRGAASVRWRRRRWKRHSEDLQRKRPAGRQTRSCRRSAGRAASISTATKIIKMSQTQKSKKTKFIPCVWKSRNVCAQRNVCSESQEGCWFETPGAWQQTLPEWVRSPGPRPPSSYPRTLWPSWHTQSRRFIHRCTQVTTWKFLHCCFLWTLCFFHQRERLHEALRVHGRWISHRLIHKDVFSSKKWRKTFPNNNLFLVLCLVACCSSSSIVNWVFILFEWLYHQINVLQISVSQLLQVYLTLQSW